MISTRSGAFLAVLALGAAISPLLVGSGPSVGEPTALLTQQVSLSDLQVGDFVVIARRGGGRTIEGTIESITDSEIKLKARFGIVNIPRDDVISVEKRLSNSEEYEKRAQACKTADDWCDLGEWARGMNEIGLAQRAFEKAVELEPGHVRANQALGRVELEGEWMPQDEAMRRQGKELYRGEWLTPDEIAARERQSQDALRSTKRRSIEERKREYEGRPWADVAPIESPNYIVYCNSTEEVARNYSHIMELLYRRYSRIFGRLPRHYTGKGVVYIHANNRQFLDWTGVEEGVGGFYRIFKKDVTAYHGTFGISGSTYEVLAHEGTHQFQGFVLRNFMAAPMWIIEGLAVFFGDGSKLLPNDIEIGVIPYDRLVGLRRFMEDDSENAPWRCRVFMMQGQPYPGAYYATAWGVIYWCLWGDRVKDKAHNGEGIKVLEDYLLRVTQSNEPCDYVEEFRYFQNLITTHTKFATFEEWENTYRDWILRLPLNELGERKGSRWVSEPLAMEVTRPTGSWRYVDADKRYHRFEIVAFDQAGSKTRRISTYCWPNENKDEMSVDLVRSLFDQSFRADSRDYADLEMEGHEDGFLRKDLHGHDTVEILFTGIPKTQQNTDTGVGGPAQGARSEGAAEVTRRIRVAFVASYDRVYANVLEAEESVFEDSDRSFETYLKNFKIN